MSVPRPPAERVIGLDVGTRRIGVAVSDEMQMIASPERTLHISQKDNGEAEVIKEIVALTERYAVRRVVIGLPRNMKGERGVQALWTEEFVARLRAALAPLNIYISLVDEQLTTAQAARTFHTPRGHSRGAWSANERDKQQEARNRSPGARPTRDGRTSLDARAAALILQGYLDRCRS
jgi:putative Holliday junction resolvase